MSRDWLLVETLGPQQVVVAQGGHLKRMVPISVFLRRSPNLSKIVGLIEETARSGVGAVITTPESAREFRTVPVQMGDGQVHGVHLWTSHPSSKEAAIRRPIVGAVKWDLTTGSATDTREALWVSGKDPNREPTHHRTFAADMPIRDLNADESKVLALALRCKAGDTFFSTWKLTDYNGGQVTASFVSRARAEAVGDGSSEHLVIRAMNWRSAPPSDLSIPGAGADLAQQILHGLAQPGLHRALVDLSTWRFLKWLDTPCPHFDWRGEVRDYPLVHPDDQHVIQLMESELVDGRPARALLRLRSRSGWTPIQTTVHKIRLQGEVDVGLVTACLPGLKHLHVPNITGI